MKIYPVLPLTEGQPLLPEQWHELGAGVLCKLYAYGKEPHAVAEYMRIVKALAGNKSSGTAAPAADERIDNCLAEITCTAGLCLITLQDALDA